MKVFEATKERQQIVDGQPREIDPGLLKAGVVEM